MSGLTITEHDPSDPEVRALIARHLAHARTHTPPEAIHALDVGGLVDPEVTMFGVRRDGQLVAMGAIRRLDAAHAELKSMHTAAEARGAGIGTALLAHLLAVAQARGYRRVSLETGTTAGFAAARALYAQAGFVPCAPFGGYPPGPYTAFMTLAL